jgi:hypothetical protein
MVTPASAAATQLVSAASQRCLDVKGNVDTLGTDLNSRSARASRTRRSWDPATRTGTST